MDDRRPVLIVVFVFVAAMTGVYVWAMSGDTIPPPAPAVAVAVPSTAPTTAVARPAPPRRSSPAPRPRFTPTTTVDDVPERAEEAEPNPDEVIVTGKVLDDRGQPVRMVPVKYKGDKGRRTTKTDQFGRFSFRTTGDSVEVWAERKDGALTTRSERQTADGPGEWEIVLELESAPRAGLGIKVKAHEDGIYVRSVMPGTPAAELGLLAGDVIFSVDGDDVGGLAVAEVTAMLTGPVGTSQRFTVRRLDGSIEYFTFERSAISATIRSGAKQ